MAEPTLSVLLPVHEGVEASVFAAATESLIDQTRPADEIVVVEDGPLPRALVDVVRSMQSTGPKTVRVRLNRNMGAGVANQAGLEAATGDWIAKADADDVSVPSRFGRQLDVVTSTDVDVCGAAMWEFDGEVDNLTALRVNPLTHEAIARRMRSNNPINHPTAMYRRVAALAAGGYPDLRFMQDYVLFARMLSRGARMLNLDDPLVYFRAGSELHARRRTRGFARFEWEVQRELRRCGLVGPVRSAANFVVRGTYRRLPAPAMRAVHGRLLASRVEARRSEM